jgi:hypothetical protein
VIIADFVNLLKYYRVYSIKTTLFETIYVCEKVLNPAQSTDDTRAAGWDKISLTGEGWYK